MKEVKEFDEEVVQIDRVTRVVKGGRRLRFRATVVIGNRKGKIGFGIGKSAEVAGAIQKAIAKAKKSLIIVPIFRDTIPHDIKVKYKASRILMMPAGEGTGIIAGGAVRKIVELAGIKNILSKSFGTNNRVSNTQATYKALGLLRKRTDYRKKAAVEEPKKEVVAQAVSKPVAKPMPVAKKPEVKKN
ncbi:30S ribosomal protein S5 [bacterium]|nr:30S ribosomal protein S5 [bacterium]